MTARRAHHRGSIYIAVLGAATLVTILGVSALLAVRTQRQAEQFDQGGTQAMLLARAGVEVALKKVQDDPNWRSTYTAGTWTDDYTLGLGTYRFKFEPVAGGALGATPLGSVRIVGQGTIDGVTRLQSVRIDPVDLHGYTAGQNLLTNAAFSANTTDWSASNWAMKFSINTSTYWSSPAGLTVSSRQSPSDGPQQDVRARLANGMTYDTRVRVRSNYVTDTAKIELYIRASGSGEQTYATTASTIDTNWRQLSGTFTPRWKGRLLEARWRLATTSNSGSFTIDEAHLSISSTSPRAHTLDPTSWRQQLSD